MLWRGARRTLFILFMPVVTAELLTGSTSLYSLLDPLTLPLLLGLYGLGAILIRELAVTWRKGWPSVMALGAAYGVVEEGLDVKSWFNPSWPALGQLSTYGRFLGVNTVWAVELTVFHAVFSIGIPLILASLLFPEDNGSRWFSSRTLVSLALVFAAVVIFGFLFFPYSPPLPQYLFAIAVAISLVLLGRRLPASIPGVRSQLSTRPLFLAASGFLCTFAFFWIFWVIPLTSVPPPADILLMVLLGSGICALLSRAALSEYQVFSLVAGALGFLMAVAIVGLNFVAGPPFVAVAYALVLLAIRRRIRAHKAAADAPEGSFGPDNLHLPTQN